ncbi:hypothetical protein RDWZM_002684 [Blomia tropicalis]|uniref:Uncharacterized protein n=1 Tax=Blomia tropicalis TaxID=40697 RepID=A0A9Q0RRT2_BLOTA|nr:hypothetical protein RDWZM_002684 [Blomia tropicalis]
MATMLHTCLVLDGIKSIWKLIGDCRLRFRSTRTFVSFRFHSIVYDQFIGYTQVTSHVLNGNREIFGAIMYTFLMTNIPVNVYLLQRNVFMKQRQFEIAIVWMVIALQLISAFNVLTLLSWSAAVYRKPAKFIPILQPMLHGSRKWLSLKIKYDNFYHRLVDGGTQIGIAIGPIHTVTYRSSSEALLIYIGYILMAFSRMIQANTGKVQNE